MSNDARPRNSAEAPAVTVVAHSPERRRRLGSSGPAQAGHCCCCCCCLHTLGAIIGAAVAPNLGSPEPRSHLRLMSYWDEDFNPLSEDMSARCREAITAEDPSSPVTPAESLRSDEGEPRIALPESGPSAVSLFWWTLLILVMGGMVFGMLVASGAPGSGSAIAIPGIIILLVLPGLQLGAAILTAVFLAVSLRPDKRYQFRQLGKIVKGVLAGTALGILVMVIIGVLQVIAGVLVAYLFLGILVLWGLYLLMGR